MPSIYDYLLFFPPSDGSPNARDSVTSNTGSVISYVLTQEPLPQTRDSRSCSSEPRPPPLPLRKVPSPLHVLTQEPLPRTRDSRSCSSEPRPPPLPLRKVPSPLHVRADTARAGE